MVKNFTAKNDVVFGLIAFVVCAVIAVIAFWLVAPGGVMMNAVHNSRGFDGFVCTLMCLPVGVVGVFSAFYSLVGLYMFLFSNPSPALD